MTAAAIEAVCTTAVVVSLIAAASLPGVIRARRIQRSIPGGMSFGTAWVRATPNVHDECDWSHLGTGVPR